VPGKHGIKRRDGNFQSGAPAGSVTSEIIFRSFWTVSGDFQAHQPPASCQANGDS